MVKKLLLAKADINAAAGHNGLTALQAAAKRRHLDVVKLLKSRGAVEVAA